MASENKRIAKNTGFLYLRMLFVMGVTLYTSRVVLQALGVDDYGLYNVIGGIVVMLGFLNGCASSATSRFLTFALGSKADGKEHYDYSKVFGAAFFIHLAIALLIVVLAETIGLWYFNNQLVIPDGRYEAAMWVYQISIINILVSFTQVPYNASIIAHERMSIYAFVGIYEAVSKLVIAYALTVATVDKLTLFAWLVFGVTLSISLFYRYYCVSKFGESCKIHVVYDKGLYKRLLSFSGWDLVGNFGAAARSQGVNLILNLFCGPAVNAARGVAYQVEAALYQFTTNFLQASRPVIIKHYAAGEIDKCLRLLFNTAKFACLLFSCLAIPFIIESDFILQLWLVNPPEYASIFLKIVLANYLIISITNTINIGIHATGDVKRLNIFAGSKVFVEIPVVYILLQNGFEPQSAFWVLLIGTACVVIIDLWILRKNIPQLSICSFLYRVIGICVLIMLIPMGIAYLCHCIITNDFLRIVGVFVSYWVTVIPLIFAWGINKDLRRQLILKISSKLHNG